MGEGVSRTQGGNVTDRRDPIPFHPRCNLAILRGDEEAVTA